MAFRYSKKQKQIALQNDELALRYAYKLTERKLNDYARFGTKKEMSKAMQDHQDIEYALLFKQSPEYLKIKNKKHIKRLGKNN